MLAARSVLRVQLECHADEQFSIRAFPALPMPMQSIALSTMTSLRSAGFWLLAISAILVFSLAAYWPFFGAHYYLDDYAFITIARYTENPLVYFIEKHFPGGLFYRPAGMLLWWLIGALDAGLQTQFLANWLLLVAAATLFLTVLMKIGLQRWLCLAIALLCCVHPVSTMTAGWLSNRFDLLASLGIFLALLGALRWFQGQADRVAVILVVCGTLVALTAKEIGLITPAVVVVLALNAGRQPARAWPVWISVLAAGLFLLVRQALTSGTDLLFLQGGAAQALFQGIRVWLTRAPEFLLPLPGGAAKALVLLLAAMLVFCAVRFRQVIVPREPAQRQQPAWVAFLLGLSIVSAAIVIQFPSVSNSLLAKPGVTGLEGDYYLAARFFYFGLIGVLLMLGAACSLALQWISLRNNADFPERSGRAARPIAGLAFLALLVLSSCGSREQGRRWAEESAGKSAVVAQAAADAISLRPPLPGTGDREGCRYYLLGTQDVAETFWLFADAVVKASVSTEVALQLGRCMISTESTPWYHVLRAAPTASSIEYLQWGPLQRTCFNGMPIAPQTFGSVEIHFMNFPYSGTKLRPESGDRVFSYDIDTSRFVDVTALVAAGARQVDLKWSRLELNRCVASQ
jgi:hypothetical protein